MRVPGTTVDYPIVRSQPKSPDFYLTHDAGGERSAWGAPYIDVECAQGDESPLAINYGYHLSGSTMFAPLAQYSSRDFAEGHRTIRVYTHEKEIDFEVFAVDVVDASSEGKLTDFADAAELDTYLGDKLSPMRDCPGRSDEPCSSLGVRDLHLPDEQLLNRRLRHILS